MDILRAINEILYVGCRTVATALATVGDVYFGNL